MSLSSAYREQLGYGSVSVCDLLAQQVAWRETLWALRGRRHLLSKREPDLCAEAVARLMLEYDLERECEQSECQEQKIPFRPS